MAAEVLGRAVHDEVGAVLDRAQVDGRRGGRVDHHARRRGGRRLEVGHRQERVRRRLQPDDVDPAGRRSRLVELDVPDSPALERPEEQRVP